MLALSLLVTGGGTAAATTAAELEEAIKRGDTLEQIVAMFEEGPEVNYKVTLLPGKEPAPLICALADDAVYGYSDEYKGLDLPYNQAEAMTALLDNGADPNARDARGRTPLHLTGHSLAQHVLLQKGADPRLEDNRGNLPVVPEAEGIALKTAWCHTASWSGSTIPRARTSTCGMITSWPRRVKYGSRCFRC